jgi:uncharacterized Zn finger protein
LKEINEITLQELAGEGAYHRGKEYYYNDHVVELRIKGNTIIADVEGSELYQVTLKHTAKLFEGSCDCPASENFDFCKHCVAAGLKYLEVLRSKEKLKGSKNKDLLKNYLASLPVADLVEQLESLISTDKLLLDEWTMKAEVAAGKLDHKAFKKRITAAIPYNRHLHRYAQVRTYFVRVEQLLEKLEGFIAEFKADEGLVLVDYALQRIEKALETIDDSGGFRYGSEGILHMLHIQTMDRLDWPKEKKGAYLLDIYMGQQIDMYPDIPASYITALGSEGLAAFNAGLQKTWDKLPALKEGQHNDSDWEKKYFYRRIQGPLFEAAKASGDIDTCIALLLKTAIDGSDMLSLSEFCLDNDRLEQAIDWLQKAREANSNSRWQHHDESYLQQEVRILCYQKKFDQALQVLWTQYKKQPRMHRYAQIIEVAELAGDSTDWYRQALDHLQSLIRVSKDERRLHWSEYDEVASLHLYHQQLGRALDVAHSHKLNPDVLLEVARANKDKPADILPIYLRLAEFELKQSNNQAYHEAIDLLKEAEMLMDKTGLANLNKALVRMKLEHKRKRNFIKWLTEAFPL